MLRSLALAVLLVWLSPGLATAGALANFPNDVETPAAVATATIETDADLATWEPVSVVLQIPPDATYLALEILAIENVQNDATAPEFDGHYMDGTSLEVELGPIPVPGLGFPGRLLLAGGLLGALLLVTATVWAARRNPWWS